MPEPERSPVAWGFEPDGVVVALDDLIETRRYRSEVRSTGKYRQIQRSIAAIGLVEPPVVRLEPGGERYFLLDGHLRVMALRDAGEAEVMCLISREDEAVTYNKRISRLTAAQEHRMIARAIDRGVPEALLAEALGFTPKTLQRRAQMLRGISPEAARQLESAEIAFGVFDVLRRMKPERQLEAVELMVAQDNYTLPFAQALLSSSRPQDLLPIRPRRRGAATRDHICRLQNELESLETQLHALQEHYGLDAMHFTLARGYVARLLRNPRFCEWITLNRVEYLEEFNNIAAAHTGDPDDLPTDPLQSQGD